MPISERRINEKLEMQQHILSTARNIAAKDGWQNLTIRKICDEIDYTAPVIYQYFESKEKILENIRYDGLQQMKLTFEKINSKTTNHENRLIEYALAWWKFALENSEIYQLMYNLQGAVCPIKDNLPIHIVEFYINSFIELNSKAKKSKIYSLELCDNYIAIIHGFIAIRMVNKIKSGNESAEKVYINSIKRFIQSIKNN